MPLTFSAWLSELTRRHVLLAIVVVAVAAGAAAWSVLNVQDAVRNSRADLLGSLVATQSETLLIWASEKQADTRQWAREPAIVALAAALMARHGSAGTSRDGKADHAAFVRRIAPAVEDMRLAAANIVAPDGTLIASLLPEHVGAKLTPAYLARLKPAFAGGSAFIGPIREQARLAGPLAAAGNASVIWTAAPVQDRAGRVVAVLCLGRRATGRFAHILEVTRPGETGESYAFDKAGMLLSQSRFEPRLRQIGLLAGEGALSPGVLPLRQYVPAAGDSPHMPLTALVGQAIEQGSAAPAGGQGTLLTPYRNYVGTPVIGAWRWLPTLELGVAVEMAESEAFAPIAFVNTNLAVLLLTLAFAVFLGPLLPPLLWRRFVPLHEGDRVGSYRLLRKIGAGGVADVYEARHERLDRAVAVKIMNGQLREEPELRFEREARILATLDHPHIVAVFDAGHCDDGRPYYVMEQVDGQPLSRLVADGGPLAAPLAGEILMQVCDALQYVHDRGIAHRDVKPDNILLQRDADAAPRIKLIDFGFAKSFAQEDHMRLTQDMSLMGTLGYLAPERIRNPADTDIRGDVFAVGALGYFLLTGKESIPDIRNMDEHNARLVPDRRLIPDDALADIVVKAMAPRKAERWPTCAALAAALDRYLGAHPGRRREAGT